MKRNILPIVFLLVLSIITSAQQYTPKLSPFTKKFLKELSRDPENPDLLHNYVYKKSGNDIFLSALVKVNRDINESELDASGIKIGTKAGNIWTLQIPLKNFKAFIQINGIDYIQIDEPAFPTLDLARADTRVDSVHSGINLPMPYHGDGVVVGVVDAGFDLHHPVFFDTTGTNCRIKKVWFQKNPSGPAPLGYSYGTEMNDTATMWNIVTDDSISHGTHVSGICAGSGFGSPASGTQYRGFAYASDIVIVGITPDKSQWISTGVSDMIDGINYIFTYADSVAKPAAVNLSWGSPLGPHDGTGLFSQALDNLTGPGKIFSCSAGNNGENPIHVKKTFSPTDSLVQTFFDIATSPEGKKSWVDMWGDTGKTFCVEVSLYNDSLITSTGFICLDDSMHDFVLIGSNNDTCLVSIITSASEFNMKPRTFLDFYNKTQSDSICISVKATDGTVHFWNSFVSQTTGYYGVFYKGRSWAINGDDEYSISDIASSKSAITVGAYCSKTDFRSIDGNTYTFSNYVGRGERVPFSSHGPTTDGRIKPDITAPGLTLASGYSSYDPDFFPAGPNYFYVVNVYHDPNNNRDYPYGQLNGTSMSSPCVTGIAALMLQVKNDLNPQEVKDIFSATAIIDHFIDTIPPGGSSTWGNGKVNAYGAIGKTFEILNGIKNIETDNLNCNLFPNPNDGSFTIDYYANQSDQIIIEICNIIGQDVLKINWETSTGLNIKSIDLNNIKSGIYFVKIFSKEGRSIKKMIVK